MIVQHPFNSVSRASMGASNGVVRFLRGGEKGESVGRGHTYSVRAGASLNGPSRSLAQLDHRQMLGAIEIRDHETQVAANGARLDLWSGARAGRGIPG
jgi:hypothetical protein